MIPQDVIIRAQSNSDPLKGRVKTRPVIMRGLKTIRIELNLLLNFLKSLDGSRAPICSGLPDDIRVVAFHDVVAQSNTISITVESDTFPQIDERDDPPTLAVTFSERTLR